MKNILSTLTILLLMVALCLVPAPAVAQTTTTTTTLAAAMTATTTTVNLTSATGVTGFTNGQPTTWLFIDREFMPVYSVNGTTAIVQRNGGGMSTTHATSSKVWVGPYNAFLQAAPAGNCTSTSIAYLPMVNVSTGDAWTCGNSKWTTFNLYPTRMTMGAQLTAAGTITPTNPWHHITGSTTITTITVPAAFSTDGGCINLIPDLVGYTTSTGGNVALASTFVASKVLTLCYDTAQSKWYPNN